MRGLTTIVVDGDDLRASNGLAGISTMQRTVKAMNDGTADQERGERRRRRLEARRRLYDTSIPSPCISVCQIGADDRCIGCYRTIDEIRDWPIMTAEEKTATLGRIAGRKSAAASS